MRTRTIVAAAFAAALSAGVLAGPASATNSGTTCSDGVGYSEHPILSSPVTIDVEVTNPPSSTGYQRVQICYSTQPRNATGGVTGGVLFFDVADSTATSNPGVGTAIYCLPDGGTAVAQSCNVQNGASVAPGAGISTPQVTGGVCLVYVNGSCAAFAPGVKTGITGGTVAILEVFGTNMPINIPTECIGVVVNC